MEYLRRCAEINCYATELLIAKDVSSAMKLYKDAVSMISSGCCQEELPATSFPCSVQIKYWQSEEPITVRKDFTASKGKAPQKCPFAARVFLFDVDSAQELTAETVTICSALAIYNCALCFHTTGNEKGFRKALSLYKQSLDLLDMVQNKAVVLNAVKTILRCQADIFFLIQDLYCARYVLEKLYLISQEECIISTALAEFITAPEA